MYQKALKVRDEHIKQVVNWEEFMNGLNSRNLVLSPWCNVTECELKVKERSKEESLKLKE